MGAWGYGPWDSDAALDWRSEFEQASTYEEAIGLLQLTFAKAKRAIGRGEHEVMAAAAIVAVCWIRPLAKEAIAALAILQKDFRWIGCWRNPEKLAAALACLADKLGSLAEGPSVPGDCREVAKKFLRRLRDRRSRRRRQHFGRRKLKSRKPKSPNPNRRRRRVRKTGEPLGPSFVYTHWHPKDRPFFMKSEKAFIRFMVGHCKARGYYVRQMRTRRGVNKKSWKLLGFRTGGIFYRYRWDKEKKIFVCVGASDRMMRKNSTYVPVPKEERVT